MKETTGEVSMTVVTLVAIAVIGGILAVLWPNIRAKIEGLWDTSSSVGGIGQQQQQGNGQQGGSSGQQQPSGGSSWGFE